MGASQVVEINEGVEMVDRQLAAMQAMSTEEVYEALRDGLRMTVKAWVTMACAIRTLEERGEDADRVQIFISATMRTWLRRIAGRSLIPELVVQFHREPKLVDRLSNLPVVDQQTLATGGTVSLIVPDGRGGRTSIRAKVDEMEPGQVRQVLASDHIRTESEQILYLKGRESEAAMPVPEQVGPFRIDRSNKVAIFTGRRGESVSLDGLLAAAAALRKS